MKVRTRFLGAFVALLTVFASLSAGAQSDAQAMERARALLASGNAKQAYTEHVGTLNNARLDANFRNRTASAAVNISINGQTWNGAANNMPIYRDQYFSAYSGTPIAGIPNPNPLVNQGAVGFGRRGGQRCPDNRTLRS
jgi:hypothetical protein